MTSFLAIGVGCRRGASADDIDWAVRDALGSLDMAHVGLVATLVAKVDEPGILEFCRRHALPLRGIDSILINSFPIGDALSSEAIQRAVGVNAVCEPCAVIATDGGELIVRKTSRAGVSVAIAAPRQRDALSPPGSCD